MQICFGCNHSFPDNLMEKVDVPSELASQLESLRSQMANMVPPTPQARQALAGMEDTTRLLFGIIKRELEARDQTIRRLEHQLHNQHSEMDDLRRKLTSPSHPPSGGGKVPSSSGGGLSVAKPRPPGSSQSQTRNSSMLDRFLQSSNARPMNTVKTANPMNNNNSGAVAVLNSARLNHHAINSGSMIAPLGVKSADNIASIIFSVVEAATVKLRAEIGVLWLQPQRDSGELIGSFVASAHHQSARGSAPYRVSATSLVGMVLTTAIAVNLSPAPGAAEDGEPASFAHHLEHNNLAMLVVPVFTRYGDASRQALGVLQFIGSRKAPMTFGLRNEITATEAASLLSHIVSAYAPSHLQEWMTRMFDSSNLSAQAAYDYTLDMRANEKCFDDFDPLPSLIYRAENADRAKPKNISVAKSLRADMQQSTSTAGGALESIREIHRHVKSMEQNWIESVNQVSALEKKNELLAAQLDAARQGMQSIAKDSTLKISSFYRSPRSNSNTGAASAHHATTPARHATSLQLLDVEDVAADAIRRLKALPTGSYLNEKGELSTPARRDGKGGVSP